MLSRPTRFTKSLFHRPTPDLDVIPRTLNGETRNWRFNSWNKPQSVQFVLLFVRVFDHFDRTRPLRSTMPFRTYIENELKCSASWLEEWASLENYRKERLPKEADESFSVCTRWFWFIHHVHTVLTFILSINLLWFLTNAWEFSSNSNFICLFLRLSPKRSAPFFCSF